MSACQNREPSESEEDPVKLFRNNKFFADGFLLVADAYSNLSTSEVDIGV